MWCPRLDHFARFNANGTISRCGHMVNPPGFSTIEMMDTSPWLQNIKDQFENNIWPSECQRCEQTEKINGTSIRLNSIKLDQTQTRTDYLHVSGVLDNICNSACQFCNLTLSTKIGSLTSVNYIKIDNSERYWSLPLERIEHLDINGGEPSASKNYKKILENLPPNLKTLRVNTNCSILLPELQKINDTGIEVTVTVSFDGIGLVHDYVRWPIKWDKFYENLMEYKTYKIHSLNLWSTINVLNINDWENMLEFIKLHEFDHSYALLSAPSPLNIGFENLLTLKAKQQLELSDNPVLVNLANEIAIKGNNENELKSFIAKQDQIRNINILDFIN